MRRWVGSSLQQSSKMRVSQRTFRVAFYDWSMSYVSQSCAVAFAFSLLLAAPLRAQVEIELEGAVSAADRGLTVHFSVSTALRTIRALPFRNP